MVGGTKRCTYFTKVGKFVSHALPSLLFDHEMRPNSPHELIRMLAFRQHGVISARQLSNAGVGRGLLASSVAAGRLFPIFPGTYAVGRPADRIESIWMAATLMAWLRPGQGAGLSISALW